MMKRLSGLFVLLVGCGSATPGGETPALSATGGSATAPNASEGSSSQVPPLPCTELDFAGCKAACAKGSAHGCTLAAESVDEDRRGEASQKLEIIGLLEKGCDGGDPEGCRDLGNAYREGRRVTKDASKSDALYKKAIGLFEASCAKKRAKSCDLLGHMTGQGWGIAKNEDEEKRLRKQAIELFEAACSAADPASCAPAGDAYQVGFWVPKDLPRASKLLGVGCDANGGESCFLLGLSSMFGTNEVPKNGALATKLLRKACDAGSTRGCSALAEQMTSGEGTPKDGPAAVALFEKACNGPGLILDAPACHDAAELRRALGESPTSPKVLELERRSCLLGFANGCEASAPKSK